MRSLHLLYSLCRVCALCVIAWRTYVLWRYPTLPLAAVGSHAAANITALLEAGHDTALDLAVLASLGGHWALMLCRHPSRDRLLVGTAVSLAIAGHIYSDHTKGSSEPSRSWLRIARNVALAFGVTLVAICATEPLMFAWFEYGVGYAFFKVLSMPWATTPIPRRRRT